MDGEIVIGTKIDTKTFDAQIKELEKKIDDLEKQEIYFSAHGMTGELQDVQVELEKTRNKLVQINAQKTKLEDTKGIENLGKSFQNSIKKASKLALGIFGIRSAYMLLRRASGDLAGYDEQYATNLEYIRWILTQAIAPILRWIVNLVGTILQYVYAILNAWFGIGNKLNLSANAFQKMKAGASGVSKAVKEIKKQLTGFDEINMLTDSGDTGAGGVGGGISAPSFDIGEAQIPAWIQWIIDNGNLVRAIIAGITGAIIALKNGFKGIEALGIGVAVAGIVYTVQALLDYLKEPTWENFGRIIQGIGIAVIGLGVAFFGLPAIIAGVVILIVGTIIKHWQDLKEKLQNGINWLKSKSDWVKEYFGIVGQFIYDFFVNTLQKLLDKINWLFTTMKNIFDGIIWFLSNAFAGNWDVIFEALKNKALEIFSNIVNFGINVFNFLVEQIQTKINTIKSFFSGLVSTVTGWFQNMGISIPENIANTFKYIINRVLDRVEIILNKPIQSINSMISSLNNIPRCKYKW